MKHNNALRGIFRICLASMIFATTSFLGCVGGRLCLSFLNHNPWDDPIGTHATWIGPLVAFASSLTAFLSYGASNGAAENPSKDFQITLFRLLGWHLFFAAGFLAPQLFMAHEREFSVILLGISALCFFPMVLVSEHMGNVIIAKADAENTSDFLKSLGSAPRNRKSKGIRRD